MPAILKDYGLSTALAIGAVLVFSGDAAAQAMPAGGAMPIGSPSPVGGERFSGNLRGQAIYASNVSGGDATIANLRGVKPEDITYDLGATINLQLPAGRQRLFLSGTADLQRHERNSRLDADNFNITGGGTGRVGACVGAAIANYSRNDTQTQDLTIAVRKNTVTQDGANVSANCSRGHLFAGIQGNFTESTNSAKTSGFIDSQTDGAAAWVGYQSNAAGNIALGGQYTKAKYTDRLSLPLGAPNGFEQYGANLTYSRKLGLRLSGSASVSTQTLKTPSTILNPAANYHSLGSDVDLAYKVSPRLNLSLGYSLSNQVSPTVNANFVRVETFRLAGTYSLNQRISVRLGGSKSNAEYRGGQPVFLQVRNSDDREVDGGASMKIGRKLSLTLDARRIDRKADLASFSYSSNQVTLGLTGAF